jgi:OFA family oxalate/formate antiporter-like MFS transporter
MVPQFMDMGFHIEQAAFALSVVATLGVLGKVVFGWLIDNFPPSLAVWVCIATQALGALGILWFENYYFLLGASAVYGFGMGGVVPLNGAVTGAAFGRLSFGRVMGLMRPATLPIQGASVPLAGWIYDQTGSYLYAFELYFAAWFIAAIAIALVKLPSNPSAPKT